MRRRLYAVGLCLSMLVLLVEPVASQEQPTVRVAKTSRRIKVFGEGAGLGRGRLWVKLYKRTELGTVLLERKEAKRERVDGITYYRARFSRPRDGECLARVVHRTRTRTSRSEIMFPCWNQRFTRTTATLTGDTAVEIDLLIADDSEERAYGLSYRASLPHRMGMAFLWPSDTTSSFWMRHTLIPLTIAFFDEDGKILSILDMEPCEADPCPTYSPGISYRGALEINQGALEEWGIGIGDTISIAP